jgi:hypothetical protein
MQQGDGPHPLFPLGISTGDVWHYTTAGGLRGILGSDCLWASSFTAMNDPGEIEYGMGILAEAWESIAAGQPSQSVEYITQLLDPEVLSASFDQVHLLSTCRDGDSLPQWRAYAGPDGVSIGLDAGVPLWSDPRGFVVSSPNIWGLSWVKVIYRKRVQVARSELFLLEVLRSLEDARHLGNPDRLMAHQLQTILQVASFKHPAYAAERELRSTVVIGGAQPPVRQTAAGSVRYVPFIHLGPRGDVQKLPITAVRYGPTASSETVAGYRRIMDEAGYEGVPLVRSSIPFR